MSTPTFGRHTAITGCSKLGEGRHCSAIKTITKIGRPKTSWHLAGKQARIKAPEADSAGITATWAGPRQHSEAERPRRSKGMVRNCYHPEVSGALIRDDDDLNMPPGNKKLYMHRLEGCKAVVKWAGVREPR